MHQEFLDFAVNLAHEAGVIMKKNFGLGTKKEWKSDVSPLTVTDTTINSLVIERVKHTYPEHSLLGEEESNIIEGAEYTWVCDPVDGTLPFSCGIPVFTFSLALTHSGVPIVGVIFDPMSDRLFTAVRGEGAFLNGEQIHVSSKDTLHAAIVDVSHTGVMAAFKEFKSKTTRFYCITYPSVLVACGEYDGTVYPGLNAWDVAAIKVIVEEAGGKVTDRNGTDQRYDGAVNWAVISNGTLHEKMIEITRKQ